MTQTAKWNTLTTQSSMNDSKRDNVDGIISITLFEVYPCTYLRQKALKLL